MGCIGPQLASLQASFDSALANGNLQMAENALTKMANVGVNTAFAQKELERAQEAARLLAKGEAQIQENDYKGLPDTVGSLKAIVADWKRLASISRARQGRIGPPVANRLWNPQYPKWLAKQTENLERRGEEARKLCAENAQKGYKLALKQRRWADAESQLALLKKTGAKTSQEEKKLTEVRRRTRELEQAIQHQEFDKDSAEEILNKLDELGVSTKDLRKQWIDANLAKTENDFAAALSRFDFDAAEALLPQFQELSGSAEGAKDRIREAKIDNLRNEIDGLFAREDFDGIVTSLDRLEELGVPFEDLLGLRKRLEEAIKTDAEHLRSQLDGRLDDNVTEPDFDDAQGEVERFEHKWRNILSWFEGRDQEEARRVAESFAIPGRGFEMYKKAWKLREAGCASWGLVDEGQRVQYWVRCTPDLLLNNEDYWVDNLKVHLLGYATDVTQNPGNNDLSKGENYRLQGIAGGRVEVSTSAGAPLAGDLVYVLATVKLRDGRFWRLAEHQAYLPAREIGGTKDGRVIPSREDVRRWMQFGYDFTLENLFRRFVCVKANLSMPELREGEWDNGIRTTVEAVQDYFATHE